MGSIFEVILGHFWVILELVVVILVSVWNVFAIVLASFRGCFGIVLASPWGRFGAFLILLGGLCAFLAKNPVIWGSVGESKKCVETLKPYFEEDTHSYRSVKE